jgi:glycosyltransferase involved in cell wall biosynthesis
MLVIVGITGPETIHIQQLVSDLGLNSRVRFLEGLPEAGLQWCYRRCELLVSPSITEGFGLPIAEGLLAGCRIICSDIPAHREIGDGRCRFVMLREGAEETLAAAIVAGLQDPKRQPTVLPQLSGPVLAKQYISLYHMLTASVSSAENSVISTRSYCDVRKTIDLTKIDSVSASQFRENEHERI